MVAIPPLLSCISLYITQQCVVSLVFLAYCFLFFLRSVASSTSCMLYVRYHLYSRVHALNNFSTESKESYVQRSGIYKVLLPSAFRRSIQCTDENLAWTRFPVGLTLDHKKQSASVNNEFLNLPVDVADMICACNGNPNAWAEQKAGPTGNRTQDPLQSETPKASILPLDHWAL